jgi:uncharacterized protein
VKCPICSKPVEESFRPFCSKRCADVDLARWFNGSYALPSDDPDDLENLEEALEDARTKQPRDKPH